MRSSRRNLFAFPILVLCATALHPASGLSAARTNDQLPSSVIVRVDMAAGCEGGREALIHVSDVVPFHTKLSETDCNELRRHMGSELPRLNEIHQLLNDFENAVMTGDGVSMARLWQVSKDYSRDLRKNRQSCKPRPAHFLARLGNGAIAAIGGNPKPTFDLTLEAVFGASAAEVANRTTLIKPFVQAAQIDVEQRSDCDAGSVEPTKWRWVILNATEGWKIHTRKRTR